MGYFKMVFSWMNVLDSELIRVWRCWWGEHWHLSNHGMNDLVGRKVRDIAIDGSITWISSRLIVWNGLSPDEVVVSLSPSSLSLSLSLSHCVYE